MTSPVLLPLILLLAAPSPPARDARWAVPLPGRPGLANLHRITPDLYRGAQPTVEGFRELKRMGIKTVVNLRSFNSDRRAIAAAGGGLRYFHIHSKAWHAEEEDLVAFLEIVGDPVNLPVFVHCQHGADRTGLMSAVYRVVAEGWSAGDALREMTEGGYNFHSVWRGLEEYLRRLDPEALRKKSGWRAVPAPSPTASPAPP